MSLLQMPQFGQIWLALGANALSRHGDAEATFYHTLRELERHNFGIFAQSGTISSPPMGPIRQPSYRNAVIGIRGSIAPAALLRLVKRLERAAGRRLGARWGPRPLDVDILDFGGRIIGHPARDTRLGTLILPHPGIPQRGFVLVPLAEAAPQWRHPILGLGAAELLARQPRLARGIVTLTPPQRAG